MGGQILMRDRKAGTTELLSVGLHGAAPNERSSSPRMTPDGKYVAFTSTASNLVPADTNRSTDAFVLDRQTATIDLVSLSDDERQTDGHVGGAIAISDDGRYVAFITDAWDVLPGGYRSPDVFVRDRVAGTTELISVSSDEEQDNFGTYMTLGTTLDMSADGRYVAFESAASNLVAGDGNRANDIFVRDRLEGTTERVSLSDDDRELPRPFACAGCSSLAGSMSADGRLVLFQHDAPTVVSGDTNDDYDVFVRDRIARTTRRVSLTDADGQTMGGDNRGGRDQRGWSLRRLQLVCDNLSSQVYDSPLKHVFIRDLAAGTTELIEAPTTPAEAGQSRAPACEAEYRAEAHGLDLDYARWQARRLGHGRMLGESRRPGRPSRHKQSLSERPGTLYLDAAGSRSQPDDQWQHRRTHTEWLGATSVPNACPGVSRKSGQRSVVDDGGDEHGTPALGDWLWFLCWGADRTATARATTQPTSVQPRNVLIRATNHLLRASRLNATRRRNEVETEEKH